MVEQELAGVRGALTGLVSAVHRRAVNWQPPMPLLIARSALTATYTAGEAAGRRPAAAQFLARRGTGIDLRPAVSGGIGPSPVRPPGL
ncbi:hypothetical protein [Streptomyces halstedii]|uniref:hypothetical protein n=1 Tax=Streptomyces halstedii TaxID=1944 RepID=UPI0038231DB3